MGEEVLTEHAVVQLLTSRELFHRALSHDPTASVLGEGQGATQETSDFPPRCKGCHTAHCFRLNSVCIPVTPYIQNE